MSLLTLKKSAGRRTSHSRRPIAAALVIAVLCSALLARVIYDAHATSSELSFGETFVCVIFCAVPAFLCLLKKPLPETVSIILIPLIPVAAFFFLESMTHSLSTLYFGPIILDLIFFWIIYALCFFASGRMSVGYIIATSAFAIIGTVNYFAISFRSSPIVPWDIASLGTALSVAYNYVYTISWELFVALTGMLALCVLAFKCSLRVPAHARLIAVPVCIIMGFAFCQYLQTDDCYNRFGLYDVPFTEWANCRHDGLFVNFFMNLKYLDIDVPESYSAEAAAELLSQYMTGDAKTASSRPDIIIIMDEAFSDLSVLGGLTTSEEVMPFYKSLAGQENVITGDLFVSVLGGNTANTEFEILTGNSLAFLPTGSVPFLQFINSDIPSLAWVLNAQDYVTSGMHPYKASGWNRDAVYPYLGFSETYFQDDFTTSDVLRAFLSDAADFEMIEQVSENHANERSMIFNVTMQNHGSYFRTYSNFTPYISVNGAPLGTYIKTETYLSLINTTDSALESLINYFSSAGKPTVIVFLGDHQPTLLEDSIFKLLFGKDTDELTAEESVSRYVVPYLIWANYDIEEGTDIDISANYLVSYMLEACGMDLASSFSAYDLTETETTGSAAYAAYMNFLAAVREEYPVVTANFWYDKDGVFHQVENTADLPSLLHDYAVIQYGLLFEPDAVTEHLKALT